MNSLRLTTPSRLHFGLLSWGPGGPRRYGGLGLMVERPGIELLAARSERQEAEGPHAGRVLDVARAVAARWDAASPPLPHARFRVLQAPDEHLGLGVGTQLGLAVARSLTALAGVGDLPALRLAELTGRDHRSGVGLHGFERGGLIVDGGRGPSGTLPPLLSRLAFPDDWRVLIVAPPLAPGLHGEVERRAFADLAPPPAATTDRLCRLVLLELLPAVAERDLARFGEALEAIQNLVGRGFAPAQGHGAVRAGSESYVAVLRAAGLRGVGQSSWGPALYGFGAAPPDERQALREHLRDALRLDPDRIFWTRADNRGAVVEPVDAGP